MVWVVFAFALDCAGRRHNYIVVENKQQQPSPTSFLAYVKKTFFKQSWCENVSPSLPAAEVWVCLSAVGLQGPYSILFIRLVAMFDLQHTQGDTGQKQKHLSVSRKDEDFSI